MFAWSVSDKIIVSETESRYALSNFEHNFCEAMRNNRINGHSPYCSSGPRYCYRSQPADTLATSLKFTAMYHAPGCTAARGRLYCRFSQGNSCKHTAPCNTLRVRGQCWRVIANQRVAARTILTAEVSARFALYEEQIATVSCVGA